MTHILDDTAPQNGVIARIRSLESNESLRPSEAAVAQFVLSDPDSILSLPIEVLAERVQISTTTVLRFCQALGFRGYKDFKIALAKESGGAPALLQEKIEPEDVPIQIARKVLQAEVQALSETLELLDERALDAAVDALAKADRIAIFGMGSSAPIVVDAYYRFLRIGLNVSTPPDSHMQAVNASLLRPSDVALMISHTGRTEELLTTAKTARRARATVISVTSFLHSPLLKYSDINLVTAVKETTSRVEAMASRLAHLFIVDVLYIALAMRRVERTSEALKRTQAAIDEQRSDFDTLKPR